MNGRIKWSFTAFLAAATLLAGCAKGDKYLNIDPSSLELGSNAQTVTVMIESSASWMSYYTADWLSSYMLDANTLRINIPNDYMSLEPRSTEITIITGDGQTRTIPVLQNATDVDFRISPEELQVFDGKGTVTQTVTVTTKNISAWQFVNDEAWLIADLVEGEEDAEGYKSDVLTLSVLLSGLLDQRSYELRFEPREEVFKPLGTTVSVVQDGVNLILVSDDIGDGNLISLSAEAAELTVSVNAKSDWTVATDDTEGRISLSLTEGGSDLVNGVPLIITIPENTSTGTYTYILTFICGGEEYHYTITQAPDEEPETPES